MPWEEELRQLDNEFAAGRIGPEEYRRLRDDLLARASSAARPVAPPAPTTDAAGEPMIWRAHNLGGDRAPSAPVPEPVPAAVWTSPEELAAGPNGAAGSSFGGGAGPALAESALTQVIVPAAVPAVVEPQSVPPVVAEPAVVAASVEAQAAAHPVAAPTAAQVGAQAGQAGTALATPPLGETAPGGPGAEAGRPVGASAQAADAEVRAAEAVAELGARPGESPVAAALAPVAEPVATPAPTLQAAPPQAAPPQAAPADAPQAVLASTVPATSVVQAAPAPGQAAAIPGQTIPGQGWGGVMVPAGTQRMSSGRAGDRLDGAEVFRSARPDRGRLVLPVVLVVVLVAVVAGAVWLFSGSDGGSDGGSQAAPAGGSAVPAPRPAGLTLAQLTAKLPALPGSEKPGTGLVDPGAGVTLGFYSNALAGQLRNNGVKQVLLLDTHQGAYNYLMLVVPSADAAGAQRETDLVGGYEASVGMGDATIAGAPARVHTTAVSVAGQTVLTGLFHSGGFTVWLGVGMVPASGPAAVSGEFNRVLRQLTTVAKPD